MRIMVCVKMKQYIRSWMPSGWSRAMPSATQKFRGFPCEGYPLCPWQPGTDLYAAVL